MATWLKHIKLTIGGTLGLPPVEEWSNTVRFKADIGEDNDSQGSITWTDGELETALDAILAPIQTWFTAGNTRISSVAGLTWVKLNMIDEQGHQMSANTHRRDFARRGGAVGLPVPHWYETMALTMRTNTKRGRANSGRIFPPMIAVSPEGSTPYVDSTACLGMGGSWADCLNGISDGINSAGIAPNLDVYPVIGSPASAGGPNPGGPLLRRVTGVVVDRVADVQHRRTAQVPRAESAFSPVTID